MLPHFATVARMCQAEVPECCAGTQEASFVTAFGFLYEEYETKYYYWESIIMLRKLLVVIVIVFLSGRGLDLQVMATIAVVSVALALQVTPTALPPLSAVFCAIFLSPLHPLRLHQLICMNACIQLHVRSRHKHVICCTASNCAYVPAYASP
jgi:hypothetical protein